ncbi:hypothetical protein VDGL01_09963 [Verticillium dahliae]
MYSRVGLDQPQPHHPFTSDHVRIRGLVLLKHLETHIRPSAHDDDDILPAPLIVRQPAPERLPQRPVVADGHRRAARHLDDEARIVREPHTRHGRLGIADDKTLEPRRSHLAAPVLRLPARAQHGLAPRPLPGPLGHAHGAEARGDGRNGRQRDEASGLDARMQAFGAARLDRHDGRRASARPRRRRAAVALHVLETLQQAVDEPAAADRRDDGVNVDVRRRLARELRDERRGARPDVRVVERRHVDAVRVARQQVRAQVPVGLDPRGADLRDVRAEEPQPRDHDLRRRRRRHNGRREAEGRGRRRARETGVAAGGAVKVHVGGRRGGDGAEHEVAHAAGLERARGLEVFELEKDVAVAAVRCAVPGDAVFGEDAHQPAARESSGEDMRGVSIQGSFASALMEPMVWRYGNGLQRSRCGSRDAAEQGQDTAKRVCTIESKLRRLNPSIDSSVETKNTKQSSPAQYHHVVDAAVNPMPPLPP